MKNEKRTRKKRIRKRWTGFSSTQIRIRVPGVFADRWGSISLKQRGRIVGLILCADYLGISLEDLSSPGLRKAIMRAGVNLNQAIREMRLIQKSLPENHSELIYRIEGTIALAKEAAELIVRLRQGGAL